jgi:hypothetical protein
MVTRDRSEWSNETKGHKRSFLESTEPPAASRNGDLEEPEDGLKVWGYMPGHVHYKVGAVEDVTFPKMLWWFNRIG